MDRWNWMSVRAYLPTAVALLFAFVSLGVLSGWQDHPSLAGFLSAARWVPLAALVAAVVLFSTTTWRLVRWEQGTGPMCNRCGGPLGRERPGVRNRGDYRRCLGCGKAVNHQHYE